MMITKITGLFLRTYISRDVDIIAKANLAVAQIVVMVRLFCVPTMITHATHRFLRERAMISSSTTLPCKNM